MKHFGRLPLPVIAMVVGDGLGYMLSPDFEPLKMGVLGIACLMPGEVFYQIGRRVSKK